MLGDSFFSALETNDSYQPESTNWVQKFWSKPTRSQVGFATLGVAANAAALSRLPWPVALSINVFSGYLGYELLAYKEAMWRKQAFLQRVEKIEPPCDNHPMLKERKKCTFNHALSFIKHKNILWYAPRLPNKKPDWQKLYIDQLSQEDIAECEMIADGENLMIRVQKGDESQIYYKKVIHGRITNLCEEPLAIDYWFTLPFVNWFKPQHWYQRLSLPANSLWAMSHSGAYKEYISDSRGIQHPNWGSTTLYELKLTERVIRLHDPYVELDSEYELSLPADITPLFVDAAASVLILIGSDEVLYTYYVDYDSLGLNPAISYTYDPSCLNKRMLPLSNWVRHQISRLPEIKNPTAVQCGQGNSAIEIRIAMAGLPGYYYKKIDEYEWRSSEGRAVPQNQVFSSVALLGHDYSSKEGCIINGVPIKQIFCHNFDPLAAHTKINLVKNDDSQIQLLLYRYKNLIKSFFGFEAQRWGLIPDPEHPDHGNIVSQNAAMPVSITFKDNNIELDLGSKSPTKPLLYRYNAKPNALGVNQNGEPNEPNELSAKRKNRNNY